ncbi:hypothetical protein EYF80_019512 [Liparis tanakae]|uniref:Uncharacterized protein n=1 Tax=Liparis tanakae TaxID=230148 RepID=A0A4Z2HX95_9TELE|nr:hypothetical protein EYF80_019512 [Liparis tanakae]
MRRGPEQEDKRKISESRRLLLSSSSSSSSLHHLHLGSGPPAPTEHSRDWQLLDHRPRMYSTRAFSKTTDSFRCRARGSCGAPEFTRGPGMFRREAAGKSNQARCARRAKSSVAEAQILQSEPSEARTHSPASL